jgi:hypothetical protein
MGDQRVTARCSELVDANASVGLFLTDVAPHLLAPPANVLRIALHPDGMAVRIVNLPVWRAHLLERLRRQVATSADPVLVELFEELSNLPGDTAADPPPAPAVALPMRYRYGGRELAFVSTVATFGAPLDVTAAELAIEAFYPADEETADALRRHRHG